MEAGLRPSLAKFHGDFVDLPVVDGLSLRDNRDCTQRLKGPAAGPVLVGHCAGRPPDGRAFKERARSMMPKSAKRFSDNIMLQANRSDHVHDFGLIRSKIMNVI